MINDVCFGIGTIIECFLLILFINVTYIPRKHRAAGVILSICGYILIALSGALENVVLFCAVFTAVNILILGMCCRLSLKKVIIHGLLFTLILIAGELIINFSESDTGISLIFGHSLRFTIESRIIYALGLLILRSLTAEVRVSDSSYSPLNIAVHAFSAAIVVITYDELLTNRAYIIIFLMLIMINIASFAAWEIIVLRTREMQKVINEKEKHDAELESYKLLYEKYEKTRIMRHDMQEQISALRSMASGAEAERFAGKLAAIGRELSYAEYTDNKVLNLLLDRKLRECHEKGIELYISSVGVSMGFISELDTVAIFSNLINNAMESCCKSEEKNIFVDFSILNDAFTVVKIENNCDVPPETVNGILKTQKDDGGLHGVGMKSVESSLKSCGGRISWSYDRDRRFFRTVIMFGQSGK